jgi:hypothetical protein
MTNTLRTIASKSGWYSQLGILKLAGITKVIIQTKSSNKATKNIK